MFIGEERWDYKLLGDKDLALLSFYDSCTITGISVIVRCKKLNVRLIKTNLWDIWEPIHGQYWGMGQIK